MVRPSKTNYHVFKDLHANKSGENALGRYCMVGNVGDDEKATEAMNGLRVLLCADHVRLRCEKAI